jgi:hypothetical protein
LEAKYGGALVIIGVHSPKFPHEKLTTSIRKAVLRLGVDHPVVNDADLVLWRRFSVESWPTFILIDPEGRYRGRANGEGLYGVMDKNVGALVKEYRARRTLTETPMNFALEREQIKGPLFFPGKVLASANRLFIADSSNNRIVVTDLKGKCLAVAGTGKEGKADGPFAKAMFADPQGLAFDGDKYLYVADRKNHVIRELNLKDQTVKTIAGNGTQDRVMMQKYGFSRKATSIGLNSPWGLVLQKQRLYIGMAGFHQIWALDLQKHLMWPFAGDGDENLLDGPLPVAKFAQPSGLSTDGNNLYVADSEDSGIRAVPLNGGPVRTVVGAGLFENGDVNGQGKAVRLQHALDVAYYQGLLYVADTYNSKIKRIDQQDCTTFVGDTKGTFNEPGGLSIADGKLYVADTSSHQIRIVDLETRAVSTLELQGVEPVIRQVKDAGTKKSSAK